MTRNDHDPDARRGLPAGYDEADPYADEDLASLPAWWRANVEEFRRFDLRPYRPPRFADGTPVPPMIEALEAELGREVRFRDFAPADDDTWDVFLGDDRVGSVGRYRHSDGYTVYEVEPDAFERLVRDAANG